MLQSKTELQSNLQILFQNLTSTLGQLALLQEQETSIREEIFKVQGKLEILNQIELEKMKEKTDAA
jgi:uncharacterized protein involved in exopolysaccharide biosynthesis